MEKYYLFLDDQQEGPFNIRQLQKMWEIGQIKSQTLYWQDGLTEWLPLSTIADLLQTPRTLASSTVGSDDPVRCPKCKSTQVTANKKGFDVMGALVGELLIGPLGFIRGFTGDKIVITCLKCGHAFQPGARR